MFGKLGRPAEDRLARQSEIYEAVSPLILEIGVRRLSMRMAARASYLSVGGLYHHFATKRALVLYGLQPDAITRRCQIFHDEYDHLATSDPVQYLNAGLDSLSNTVLFVRPAFQAALELGIETFNSVLQVSIATAGDSFTVALQNAFPDLGEDDLYQMGRSAIRAIMSALLDKGITVQEFRSELSALMDGYFARQESATIE